jgi:putative transcriptional regulator
MNLMRKSFRVAVLALCSLSAAAQTPVQGDLLVASPEMVDPNFSESVLLLLRHNESGTIAVLLNRPTNLLANQVFADVDGLADFRGTLFYGGPVLPTRLLLLLRDPPGELVEGPAVVDDIFVSGEPNVLNDTGSWHADDSKLRLYAGHTAWEPGQLENEIAEGRWMLLPERSDLVFAGEPLDLWRQAMSADGEVVVRAGQPVAAND